MEILVYDGPKLISEGAYAELERRSKENMLISLQTELGTDYFADPLARLERMRDRTDTTPTGWKDIDQKLYGGMNRGEITFFAGGPGTGKSLFLQNLALNWVQMGLNVIYITLELSEELVGLRFDAMITETPTSKSSRTSRTWQCAWA
jgi:predicted ATP-dependent serine protease